VRWPEENARREMRDRLRNASPAGELFQNCIGFLDGTLIAIPHSPAFELKYQNADYFSHRKQKYGLQCILI
jgi:hypothetical protein